VPRRAHLGEEPVRFAQLAIVGRSIVALQARKLGALDGLHAA
jgi:hypothetical protein